ncbi:MULTISPECIES: FAD-dependent oxidoreductase [unclassified Brenneria]|uniref:FAD-dependent oxidoreductase n=1 Tax=unclassified Brenneria TaxID=2634434 RepID=UPI001F410EC8|nr:FAD-dependent oxidoreductase [Brenneria sp. L3-3C-1]MEE3641586.1 FAD-dependent oxidoreductase [Brenneria sp. L3_3C_1]
MSLWIKHFLHHYLTMRRVGPLSGVIKAVASYGIAMTGIAICHAQGLEKMNAQQPAVVEKADVVIIGAGAAGTAAAMAAGEKGAKVIVVEKSGIVGGAGNFAEGIFAADSRMQKRQGIRVTPDMAFNAIMDYSHWKANPYVARSFVDKSADTIDWVMSKGVEFEYIGPGTPGGWMTWHVIKGPSSGRGRVLITHFHDRLKAMDNVKIMMKTVGKSLITDKGVVTGMYAEDSKGNAIRIDANAVIIATGGFSNNKKMLKDFIGIEEIYSVASAGKDGDGLNMAWAAGAGKEGLGTLHGHRPGVPGTSLENHAVMAAGQPYLWVDRQGRRFTNEENIIMWPHAGNALVKAGGVMYTLYDEATREHLINDGIKVGLGDFIPTGTRMTKLDADFASLAQREPAYAFKADTLAELAALISVDPDVLQDTVEGYNQFAEAKRDRLFTKNPDYLLPVKTAPFYAIKSISQMLGTLGGIKIDGEMRVATEDNQIIAGLYAAGDDAGGMYGDTYDLNVAGGTFGFALNSGRIAGENAVDYLRKNN